MTPPGHRPDDLLLAWPAPAAAWTEAAPIGNGRLGAMVFGGTRARLQINDATVWSGTPSGPRDALAAVLAGGAGPERLAEVRAALRAGDQERAEALVMTFEGPYSQEYLPYADLWMTLHDADSAVHHPRTLNLDTATAAETIDLDGTRITRLTFADATTGALCAVLEAAGAPFGLTIELTTPLRESARTATATGITLGVDIPADGAPAHEPATPAHRYADTPVDGYDPFGAIAAHVTTDGATTVQDGAMRVEDATRVLVTLASSTFAAGHFARDPHGPADRPGHLAAAAAHAATAAAHGAEALLRGHQADVRALLGGTALRIGARRGGTYDVARDILSGADEQLTATVLFQYGRHLLACASRPRTGPPANLQGIWNDRPRPPWSANYTVNINAQMNYWGAEAAGLSSCHEPLFDLLDHLAEQGTAVARELYGADGWVAHHNTDMWGWALPVGMGHGNPSWAIWMGGGAWLVQHLWDHYEFTLDTDFLRDRAWPLLRGCAAFLLDWLTEDGTGHLGTLPSTSPENLFLTPDGRPHSLTRSAAMDSALIHAVLTRTLAAAEVLALEDPLLSRAAAALPRLHPQRVAAGGWLQEWADDLPEADPHHRHLSQLVAVHPLGRIDPDTTPELADAARALLDRRGPGAMGWSWAWKIALRARLRDAGAARSLFREATRPLDGDPGTDAPVDGSEWGGLLPNLFSTHPPFQIDGNYGLMAAVTEMLVQSQGVLRLLPALPAQWPDGALTGVRCRGGLAADLAWTGGALTAVTLYRLAGGDATPVRLALADGAPRAEVLVRAGLPLELDPATLAPRNRKENGPC